MAESGWVERAAKRIYGDVETGADIEERAGVATIIREEYAKDELRVAAVELARKQVGLYAAGHTCSHPMCKLAQKVLRLAGEA